MKITEEEYNQIIQELVERLRDLIYINAEAKINEIMPQSYFENLDWKKGDNLEIDYNFQIVVNDLIQILGRIRRKYVETKI